MDRLVINASALRSINLCVQNTTSLLGSKLSTRRNVPAGKLSTLNAPNPLTWTRKNVNARSRSTLHVPMALSLRVMRGAGELSTQTVLRAQCWISTHASVSIGRTVSASMGTSPTTNATVSRQPTLCARATHTIKTPTAVSWTKSGAPVNQLMVRCSNT